MCGDVNEDGDRVGKGKKKFQVGGEWLVCWVCLCVCVRAGKRCWSKKKEGKETPARSIPLPVGRD